jgi:phytanoyl-CoA hydroxylase
MKRWLPSLAEIESYRREGVLTVRGLLDSAEVNRYRRAVDAQVEKYLSGRSSEPSGYERVFIQLHLMWQRDETLRELSFNPTLARIASALGEMSRVRIFLDQIIYKQPGAEPTRAHQDAPYLSFNDSRSLNCWVALDDTTRQNGALEYLIGSHHGGLLRLVHLDRQDELLRDFPALRQSPVRLVDAQAGDVVFHNCHIVHRAYANSTDRPRRAYSIQFMPDGALYNGWLHPFMERYAPTAGQALDYECFPLVDTSGATAEVETQRERACRANTDE